MRIKKLEVAGFKSFGERVRLSFGHGITGVVGPNGCGKSNVVDAVRWCMGEMSAKHLRGRAMQDVIFAGSDSRGPQGMAEVTLTFDNDGNVPPSYLDYAEIAVTRRLFRDGSSEYLINKAQVRLRDVTDLFLGTGVGTRAYSIIEQGRIGFVVNSRPEERRTLIEEVAGITKFKARKAAAERRMQATEQNLLRVRDVVAELERQLEGLRKQAAKAARFVALRDEQRDLELHAAVLELLRIGGAHRVQAQRLAALGGQMDDAQRGLVADEAALEASRLRLADDEHLLREQQAACAALDAALAALARDVAHWRQQADDAERRAAAAVAEASQAAARIDQAEGERAQLRADAEGLEAAAVAARDVVEGAGLEVDALRRELAALDGELDGLRRAAMGHVQGVARERSRVGQLGERAASLQARCDREAEARGATVAEQAACAARAESLAARRDAVGAERDAGRARLEALRAQRPQLSAALEEAGRALAAGRDLLGRRRARLASLEEIVGRLEGCSEGVRALLGGPAPPPVGGLQGLVARLLQVAPAYERAVEAVLGERLQYILVDDADAACRAIAHLEAKGGGRGGFVPPGVAAPPPPAAPPTGPEVLGPALAQVRLAPEHAALGAALLGDVLVVHSLEAALTLRAAGGAAWGWTCVTPSGCVLDRHGALLGGSDSGAGLLATGREIRELHGEVAEHEAAVAAAKEAHAACQAARTRHDEAIAALGQAVHGEELAHMGLVKDHDAVARELRRLEQALAAHERQIAAWGADLAALATATEAAHGAVREAEAGQQASEWRLAELQERRQGQASRLTGHSDALTAAKVRIAASEERAAAAAAALRRLDGAVGELQQRRERSAAAATAGAAEAAGLRAKLAAGDAAGAEQQAAAQAAQAALLEARARHDAEAAAQAAREQALRTLRRGSEGLHEALAACRLELQRLALARQALEEQVQQRHDLALTSVVCDFHLRPLPSAAQRRRTGELERLIRALGPISLTAIDECAQVEGRFAFLRGQQDDLGGALAALREAIGRINQASRERFLEAFEAVNEMFKKVYPRLFRGGVARLELTSRDDLLEAGVDIVAMPPGKKLQNVGLLSGGEKALTATALVFAIFLIKPSPFCILDEVDAPLDEANVGRFNDMLREISKVSQFIVITHNKQTMLQADRLYGVTMEEPGMSKVVAVDLARDDQSAA